MLEIVDPSNNHNLHNYTLNARLANQLNDNNNNTKYIVEATKSEKNLIIAELFATIVIALL